jgi:oligopeptide/dipeptide ABC transporter ATP-binding protein
VGRLISRLIDPDGGEVHFDGERIDQLPPSRFRPYRSRIQVVFQDPFDSLNPRWTVERLIREPLDLHGRDRPEAKRARVAELLDLVGLPAEVAGERPAGLSAGRQQRVCIARALATRPDFIVLDEPTSALPPGSRAEMIALLSDLKERLGLSFLLISHDLSTVRRLCEEIAVMYLSQVVEVGTGEQVFRSPRHPYTRALLGSVLGYDPRDRRVDRPRRADLEGEIPSPVDLPRGCYLAGRCPFVTDRCRAEPQVLQTLEDGRRVRCWRAAAGEI